MCIRYGKFLHVIELKYLPKKERRKAKEVKAAAITQLTQYLQADAYLQSLTDLKAYVVLFVGNEGMVEAVK